MKWSLLLCVLLAGCGVGSDPASTAKTMAVRLDANTVLPSPFVLGPSGEVASSTAPIVTFVTGPVVGPIAVVNPTIVSVNSTTPKWCTDGFVVGPCTPLPKTCAPDSSGFVAGPC